MMYRVLKEYDFKLPGGGLLRRKAGQLVEIEFRKHAEPLLREQIIGPFEFTHLQNDLYSLPAGPKTRTLRVGIWLYTSSHYSGGRIHMYQYAWTLASLGAEVFMMTNQHPRWAKDYPPIEEGKGKLAFVLEKEGGLPPPDLDIVVTDSKTDLGKKALGYVKQHPACKFFCMNFETPNWVQKFVPEYAANLALSPEVFQAADFLLANSQESARHLLEWVNRSKPCFVLPPAVNTFRVDPDGEPYPQGLPTRPYMVFSARSAQYKNGALAWEAIKDLEQPMDLVVFGQLPKNPASNALHRVVPLQNFDDRMKYHAYANAHAVLAPSLFEGYGMVPAEALAAGTQVVAFDLPVLREEYGPIAGLNLVKWGDEEAFKQMVRDIAVSAKPQLDTIEVRQNHGMERMAKRIETLPYHCVKKRKVTAHLISYWGFLPESLESVYDWVDEIIVAYGPVQEALDVGAQPDGSYELLQAFPDPDKKIKLEARVNWGDKRAMRNWCMNQATGNWHLLLDGDEIWDRLDVWLDHEVQFSSPRWINFWHSSQHWIHDAPGVDNRWGKELPNYGSRCPHYRWSWWRPTYSFKKHPLPYDAGGDPVFISSAEAALKVPQCAIYHLGHALPKQTMMDKHNFYLKRDGKDDARRNRRDAWHHWNGNEGDCGDGIVKLVTWELPDLVVKAFERLNSGT